MVELVAVPPDVVTEIGPEVAPEGTDAATCVSEFTAKDALVPLNFTAEAPVKLFPAIVTDVPTGPLVGVNIVIVGAGGFTVVTTVEELLLVLGSVSSADTLAVLEIMAATVGVTTIVTIDDEPLARAPRLHMTVAVPEHVPCDEDDDTNVTLPGSVSAVVTPVAVPGPLLVTVSV